MGIFQHTIIPTEDQKLIQEKQIESNLHHNNNPHMISKDRNRPQNFWRTQTKKIWFWYWGRKYLIMCSCIRYLYQHKYIDSRQIYRSDPSLRIVQLVGPYDPCMHKDPTRAWMHKTKCCINASPRKAHKMLNKCFHWNSSNIKNTRTHMLSPTDPHLLDTSRS